MTDSNAEQVRERVEARDLFADEHDKLRRQGQLFVELADLPVEEAERSW